MNKTAPVLGQDKNATAKVAHYYDNVADSYFEQYQRENLASGRKYPQNYFRLQLLVQRLAASQAKSVYEVGTGEGTPLSILAGMGLQVAGCDISKKMVAQTRQRLKTAGVPRASVQWGDIQDSLTLSNQVAKGPSDALVAFGVMPHVANDVVVLRNMRMLVREGGKVYIEFRNKLFSLFTFNRMTKEFILDDLLAGVDPELKKEVARELDKRVALNQPAPRKTSSNGETVSYDTIRARFHNPFEVLELFQREGFKRPRIHWYHFHPAPPMLENNHRDLFWAEAARLEHNSSNWRGYFLCSAFIVEAEA